MTKVPLFTKSDEQVQSEVMRELRTCHQPVISSLQLRWIDNGMLYLGGKVPPGIFIQLNV